MRALVQRVVRAEVTSRDAAREEWDVAGSIGAGLCVFVGVTHDDTTALADRIVAKIHGLRVFDDAAGVMNLALQDVPGSSVLIVSQFTLYGDTRKGRRPSWVDAAAPDVAEPLVDRVAHKLRELGAGHDLRVATGRFRTEMRVDLVNDGPVTLLLEV
jgi:D-tyrosyl-tRNA(Tyr) deacylase